MFDPMQYLAGTSPDASITAGELNRIYELGMALPEGAAFLELGIYRGRSACLLAYVASLKRGSYVGIDHFQHPGCSAPEVLQLFRDRGLLHCAELIQSDTQAANWDKPIDFLHIDADHCSPGVDRDIAKYLPWVKVGGVVAFDDYVILGNEPAYPDISRAADLACKNDQWEDLGAADGMKFWRRR